MNLWIAVIVLCIESACALVNDTVLVSSQDECVKRLVFLDDQARQHAPQAVTMGACVPLPLKVS